MGTEIRIGARTFIKAEQILFLEADINYTTIYYLDGSRQIISYTLGKVSSDLMKMGSFLRISRQIIINRSLLQPTQEGCFEVLPGRIERFSRRRKISLQS
jgi:DNA-binding LytR/AlgR family response regulator